MSREALASPGFAGARSTASAVRRLIALLLLTVAACGGDDDPVLGDPDLQVGVFEVELTPPDGADPGTTSLLGTVYDAEQPVGVVWNDAETDGDCVLRTPEIPFCATPCGSDAVCVDTDVCQPYATKQDVGEVTATGFGDEALTLQEVALNYQLPVGADLDFPPFAEGDALQLAAAGAGDQDAFALDATGIAPLDFTTTALDLAPDTALALAWDPPAGDLGSTIVVKLDISHHGGTRGKIDCVTDDDGELELGASLITGLLDLGAAGYPTIIVSRELTGATVIADGRVDLIVRSEVERAVDVPGIESCTENDDCTPPATCQDDLTCQ